MGIDIGKSRNIIEFSLKHSENIKTNIYICAPWEFIKLYFTEETYERVNIYIYISIGNPARESSRAWRRNILDTREDRVSFTRCGIKYRRLVYLFRYRDRFDIDLITRRRNDNLGIV